MKKYVVFLVCATVLLAGCSTKKTSTLDQQTNATPQPVVQKSIQWKTLSRATPSVSLKYPETAEVTENNTGNALLNISFKLSDSKAQETLSLMIQKTKYTKTDVEDLDTDNYNGAEQTYGKIKANCYFRKNSYVQDQYTFLNKRYTGNDPNTGYRRDCTALLNGNYVYLKYMNDIDDLSYYRERETILNEMLASME